MLVYHGSDRMIRHPQYLGGKADNDYGNGFTARYAIQNPLVYRKEEGSYEQTSV